MTTFSRHAREQMERRGITLEDVESALRKRMGTPDPGSRPDTIVLTGIDAGGRLLKIVVDSVDNNHVVTAYEG
jgi:hypothetical protein